MDNKELLEFIAMLLIENKCKKESEFYSYFVINSNRKTFNERYKELLDKFLNYYALIKTEKSEKIIAANMD